MIVVKVDDKDPAKQEFSSPTNTRPIVAIDPGAVPDEEYTTACRVLASSIRLALSDPEKRADFERWKAAREATG